MSIILNLQEQNLVSIVLPEKTESYSPIAHYDFISNMQSQIAAKGFEIVAKKYVTDKSGNRVIGRYTLNHSEADIALQVAFKNSYDKSMSAGFCLGSEVMICGNGMVKGEYAFKRKHTGDAEEDVLTFMGGSIDASLSTFEELVRVKNAMKQRILLPTEINELIGELYFTLGILKAEQLSIVREQYKAKEQIFDYGVDKDCVWNLYNLCTQAVEAKAYPNDYIKQQSGILKVFAEVVNFEEIF